jgi:hypothetical protein
MRILLTLAAVLLSAVAAHAGETCPALDRSHASAALGGDAQLAVEWHAANDYVCNYTAGANTLTITISTYRARQGWPSYTAQCFATPQPLVGIGNEAVACYSPDNAKPASGEVISHVTDTYLEVRLTLQETNASFHETLRHTAELVAGSLN